MDILINNPIKVTQSESNADFIHNIQSYQNKILVCESRDFVHTKFPHKCEISTVNSQIAKSDRERMFVVRN